MTARILVVDDEPDLEDLIQQKFRHQIRDGSVGFLFARDGVEALTVLAIHERLQNESVTGTSAAVYCHPRPESMTR